MLITYSGMLTAQWNVPLYSHLNCWSKCGNIIRKEEKREFQWRWVDNSVIIWVWHRKTESKEREHKLAKSRGNDIGCTVTEAMFGLADSLWIYLICLFVCSSPLIIPSRLLVLYSPFKKTSNFLAISGNFEQLCFGPIFFLTQQVKSVQSQVPMQAIDASEASLEEKQWQWPSPQSSASTRTMRSLNLLHTNALDQ